MTTLAPLPGVGQEPAAAGAVDDLAATALTGLESAVLTTVDGVRLIADLWHPAEPIGAAVVIAQGFTSTRWKPHMVRHVRALTSLGYHVISYDARGHGDSEGQCTLGHDESLDVAAAVEVARLLAPHTVVVGSSMGAIAALRYASLGGMADGIVTVGGPAEWRLPRSVQGVAAAALTQTSVGRRIAARHLGVRLAAGFAQGPPPVELAAGLRIPLAVVHGAADRVIPLGASQLLHAAAGAPACLEVVTGGGHSLSGIEPTVLGGAVGWTLDQLGVAAHVPAPRPA